MLVRARIELHEGAMFPYKIRTMLDDTGERPLDYNDGFNTLRHLLETLDWWGFPHTVLPFVRGEGHRWSIPFHVERIR